MARKIWKSVAASVVLALLLAACSSSSGGSNGGSSGTPAMGGAGLTGAGSTFAQPIYQQWASDFANVESGTQINYQGIGSGGGISAFAAKTVDFGATDVPLQSADISTLNGASYVEFPTALGAVAIVYNVDGVKSGLKLDAATAANIFLGNVTKWNDPAIASQNPGVKLPALPIQIVHRSDESGTTAVFTTWLSDGSPEWKSKVGADKAVQWPVGVGANGSSGVAAAVGQTQGSISYVSQDYAATANLSVAAVKRSDGTYVTPSVDAICAAGGGLKFPIASDTNILNSDAKGAYPIASTTYVIIYTDQTDQQKAQTLVDFWYWGLTKGQDSLKAINYAPLPKDVAKAGLAELAKITVNGQPVTASASVMG